MSFAQKPPRIPQGWLRAVLLLVVYLAVTLAGGYFLRSLELWVTLSCIAAVALVYIFRKYIDRKSFTSIGLFKHRMLSDSVAGLSLGSLLVCAGTLIIYFLDGIEWLDISLRFNEIMISLIVLLMVAIAEELVFRGYILRNLTKSFSRWLSLLISALLFTIVHLSNPGFPAIAVLNTFLGGVLMGLTFMHTRNLWFPVFFHFSWNFLQGPILGYRISGLEFNSIITLQIKGNNIINGGNYGFEGSLVCSVLLMLAVIIWMYLERKKHPPAYLVKY